MHRVSLPIAVVASLALLGAGASCSRPAPASRAAGEPAAAEPLARGALRPELLGCLRLLDPRPDSAWRRYARAVRLDSAVVQAAEPGVRALAVLEPTGVEGWRESAWAADSLTDSVRLWIGDGLNFDVYVFAAPEPGASDPADTLSGRVGRFSDAGGRVSPEGAARATRCGTRGPGGASP